MQLRTARLCLDCEEIHEAQQCPVCLSEAFVFLTRWVPAEERRTRRLPSATKVVPEKPRVGRWVQRGVIGLAVMAASRWLLQATPPGGTSAARSGTPTDPAGRANPAIDNPKVR